MYQFFSLASKPNSSTTKIRQFYIQGLDTQGFIGLQSNCSLEIFFILILFKFSKILVFRYTDVPININDRKFPHDHNVSIRSRRNREMSSFEQSRIPITEVYQANLLELLRILRRTNLSREPYRKIWRGSAVGNLTAKSCHRIMSFGVCHCVLTKTL